MNRRLGATCGALSFTATVALACDYSHADPLAALASTYPGIRVYAPDGQARIVYGRPMSVGLTGDDAAERFWSDHGQIFRGTRPELTRKWSVQRRDSSQIIMAYTQTIRGIPVEGANARIIVGMRGGVPCVTFASARLAGEPTIGAEQPLVPREVAAAIVRLHPAPSQRIVLGQPELVVLIRGAQHADAWVWRIRTFDTDTGSPWTYYVETRLGQVVMVRRDSVAAFQNDPDRPTYPVEVTLRGMATPGMLPSMASNPPMLTLLPQTRIGWRPAGTSVWNESYTSRFGVVVFDTYPSTLIDLRSVLGPTAAFQGQYLYVVDAGNQCTLLGEPKLCQFPNPPSAATQLQLNVTSPGSLMLDFAGTGEPQVAQMNVVHHMTLCRSYLVDRTGEAFVEQLLPHTLRIVVNPCWNLSYGVVGAEYLPASHCPEGRPILAFQRPAQFGHPWESRSAAYSSFIAHEYGHYILDALIGEPTGHPAQENNSFGEGFGDAFSALLYDDQVIAREWQLNAPFLRDPVAAHCLYPNFGLDPLCECTVNNPRAHSRGQVLSGSWWRIRESIGLEAARSLHVNWMLLTLGADGNDICNGTGPGTAVEVLVADTDDAGNMPNIAAICEAFHAHGIHFADCP